MEEQEQRTYQTIEIYQEETVAIRTRGETLGQSLEEGETASQIFVSGIPRKREDDEDSESRKRQRVEDVTAEVEPSAMLAEDVQTDDVMPDAAAQPSSAKKPAVMVGVVVAKTSKEQKGDYEDFSSVAENEASPRPRRLHRRRDDQPTTSPAAKADVDERRGRQSGGRAGHIKFGDDETSNGVMLHAAGNEDVPKPIAAGKPSVEDDDDDEAPEAVPLSLAHQTANHERRKVEAAFQR